MSVLHTARINGHEPFAYLKDVLERLPSQPASRIDELLPYHWQPATPIQKPITLGEALPPAVSAATALDVGFVGQTHTTDPHKAK